MTENTETAGPGFPVKRPVGPAKITPAQANMLRNERDGKPLDCGLSGRSAHGGATLTMQSLLKRGLLARYGGITAAGSAALDAFDARHNDQAVRKTGQRGGSDE